MAGNGSLMDGVLSVAQRRGWDLVLSIHMAPDPANTAEWRALSGMTIDAENRVILDTYAELGRR